MRTGQTTRTRVMLCALMDPSSGRHCEFSRSLCGHEAEDEMIMEAQYNHDPCAPRGHRIHTNHPLPVTRVTLRLCLGCVFAARKTWWTPYSGNCFSQIVCRSVCPRHSAAAVYFPSFVSGEIRSRLEPTPYKRRQECRPSWPDSGRGGGRDG